MNISVKNIDKNKINFEVSYDISEYEKIYKKVLDNFRNRVKIPGFRPGKAPDSIIKNSVGEEAILEEIKKEVRDRSVEQIFRENKDLFPAIETNFDDFKVNEPKIIVTTYKIPEIKELDLNEVVNEIRDISERDVENMINQIREEMKEFVPKENGFIESGDYVILKYRLNKEGDFKEISLVVGEKRNLLEEHVVGLSIGDKKELKIDSNNVEIEIVEIKMPRYPEIDEKFIKDFGVNSLDEFKEKVKERILNERLSENNLERIISEKLVSTNDFYVPRSYIKDETFHKIENLKEELIKSGYKLDDFLRERGESFEELQNNFDNISNREIKFDIILDILSEGVEVNEEDIKSYYPDNYEFIINNEEQKKRVVFYLKKVKYIKNLIEKIKKLILNN